MTHETNLPERYVETYQIIRTVDKHITKIDSF